MFQTTNQISFGDVDNSQSTLLQGWRGITQHQRAQPDAHGLGCFGTAFGWITMGVQFQISR